MSDFRVHILGCGSALPTLRHLPTAQVVELRGKVIMIDCGEGAQHQLRRQGISFDAVTIILITHLHGDHIFGLWGLISSMSMLGRQRSLRIVGPRDSKRVLGGVLALLCDWIGFDIELEEYDDRQTNVILDDRSMTIESIPLSHRIPTQGYLIREKCQSLHLDKASCEFYGVPLSGYPSILSGADWVNAEGETIPNKRLTRPGRQPRSYAMCSDTTYLPELSRMVHGVSLLYHEATFLSDRVARARETYHTTAREAGMVARDAEVGRLIIGHYSARYQTTEELLREAQEVFADTIAATEGMIIDII